MIITACRRGRIARLMQECAPAACLRQMRGEGAGCGSCSAQASWIVGSASPRKLIYESCVWRPADCRSDSGTAECVGGTAVPWSSTSVARLRGRRGERRASAGPRRRRVPSRVPSVHPARNSTLRPTTRPCTAAKGQAIELNLRTEPDQASSGESQGVRMNAQALAALPLPV